MFNYKREKELRKRELEMELKEGAFHDFEEVYQRGLKQKAENECKWHGDKEKKETELAKLDVQIEERKAFLQKSNELQKLIDEGKEREIQLLKGLLDHQKEIINQLTNTIKEFKPQPVNLHTYDALRIQS